MDEQKLEAVRRAKGKVMTSMPAGVDVIGIGIGMSGSDPALKINLQAAPPDWSMLPKAIDGVPVTYDFIGAIKSR